MIQRLPDLAQIAVIRQMELYECFFLGSLSKKSKRIVQRSIKKTFNGTVICMFHKQIEVCNISSENQETGIEMIRWSKCDKKATKKYIKDKWITLEYNGIMIKCRLIFDYDLPMIRCAPEHIKRVPLALQKAISDVFNISKNSQVRIDFSSKNVLTDFPDTTQVDHIYDGFAWEVNEQLLNSVLERVHVKYSIQFANPLRFNPTSPIFSLDHLLIYEAQHLSKECFLNFAGKSAIFQNFDNLNNQDLIDFVNMWLNGTNTKLEAMVVVESNSFDREKVLEEFETVPWNPRKRDGRFKYPENTQTLEYSKDILDCTQQVDIQRKHDGLLATIVITDEEFCFFVWYTPFARPGQDLPITVLDDDDDQSLLYLIGSISF